MNKAGAAVVVAGTIALGVATAGSLITSSNETTATVTEVTTTAWPQLPPYGAKVDLRGCAQNASVTVKTTTVGLVLRSYDAVHWATKSESLDKPLIAGQPDTTPPTPPMVKWKQPVGEFFTLTNFTAPQKFRLYFASAVCPGTTLPIKWNASIVTVTVVKG